MSSFFEERWKEHGMPEAKDWKADPMIFFVGGYDEGQPYGRVFQFDIPRNPKPSEVLGDKGNFGAVWGGQRMFVDRLIQGFDDNLAALLTARLSLTAEQQKELVDFLKPQSQVRIPYPFLPLQDCVDLTIFLIRTTIDMQKWLVDVRGVGGAIDVATITKTVGFTHVQTKAIQGERRQ